MKRCSWAESDPQYLMYHDDEWGVPVHNDRKLFEMLILEGAQAGLNWLTILRKRETYRLAFDNFDPVLVANYDDEKVKSLLQDPGIIRNKLKVRSAIQNAQAFLRIQKEYGDFDTFIWGLVGGKPRINVFTSLDHIPAHTEDSVLMSKTLKKRGFNFVGPTICYAYMQSVGMVNDHAVDCFRYKQLV